MREYKFDYVLNSKDLEKTAWQPEKDENKYITETAGFVPLDVKFARFQQAGIKASFSTSEFTSSDYREMYLNPDFEITPEDDFEEIQEKLNARNNFINELKKAKSQGKNEMAGTEEPEKKPPEAAETVEETE